MNLVMIDTHIAVALYKGQVSGLSPRAQRVLDAATLRYSPMVSFELELLHEIGRIKHGALAICDYLNRELDIAESADRMSDIVRHALPLEFTRDPFDRLIVAHADLLNAPLVTLDERMLQHYARAVS